MTIPNRRAARASVAFLLAFALTLTKDARTSEADRKKWQAIYGRPGYVYGLEAMPVLVSWEPLLRSRARGGKALDVASGECQNAIFLARLGYQVDCVDISGAALEKGRALARKFGVTRRVRTIEADLERYETRESAYDCIINMRFCMRRLAPQIVRALKPGGILIFESWTVDDDRARQPHAVQEHFLKPNELLRMFEGLLVAYYHERKEGGQAIATLVARRPGSGDEFNLATPSVPRARRASGSCPGHTGRDR